MGRRSLPRVDKNIDLSEYLYELAKLPDSWSIVDFFVDDAELELEVGSGKGLFMQTAASDHPDRNFVGIEIAGKYARFAAAKLARRGLTNAKMLHGDAMRLIQNHVPDASLAAVHVYFPDPWWKKRHFKRRIMNDTFLKHVQRVLKPEGELHFWTDVEEYFESALEQVAESTSWKGLILLTRNRPSTISTTARISNAACASTTKLSIGRCISIACSGALSESSPDSGLFPTDCDRHSGNED